MGSKKWEVILWSIALPGLGQLLNKAYIKGILLIICEFVINVNANLNSVVIASFYGNISKAIQDSNFQWLMFYPCFYLFSMWDAYRDAGGRGQDFSFLPFVFSAFLGTIGVIYSSTFRLFGVLIGPIFLPILFLFLGAGLGKVIKQIIKRE